VGSNGILECEFLSKCAHRTFAFGAGTEVGANFASGFTPLTSGLEHSCGGGFDCVYELLGVATVLALSKAGGVFNRSQDVTGSARQAIICTTTVASGTSGGAFAAATTICCSFLVLSGDAAIQAFVTHCIRIKHVVVQIGGWLSTSSAAFSSRSIAGGAKWVARLARWGQSISEGEGVGIGPYECPNRASCHADVSGGG
jgi:hypothetical protein